MNEFPKCLYLGGDVEAAYVVVFDPEQQALKKELGYLMLGEEKAEPAPEKPKRGRPRKAE